MYCSDVYKQAKDLVVLLTAAFLAGRLYEKIKMVKTAIKKAEDAE